MRRSRTSLAICPIPSHPFPFTLPTAFRPPPQLARALSAAGALGPAPVIAYCGSGISATVDLFALALLGREQARCYDGSLTEWTREETLPVEVNCARSQRRG